MNNPSITSSVLNTLQKDCPLKPLVFLSLAINLDCVLCKTGPVIYSAHTLPSPLGPQSAETFRSYYKINVYYYHEQF